MSSSSLSSYRAANGAVIQPSDSTARTLKFDEDSNDDNGNKVWTAPKIHPSFNLKNLRNINAILKERRLSKSKSKSKSNQVIQSKPLPTIKKLPTVKVTERFTKSIYNISADVYKPTLPFPNPTVQEKPRKGGKSKAGRQERPKSKFVDDSAIESDGEGGNVPSVQSSPDRSKDLKFVNCDLCGLEVSSNLQLERHRGSKKCRKLRSQGKPAPKCFTCSKVFVSTHDLRRHKFARNH